MSLLGYVRLNVHLRPMLSRGVRLSAQRFDKDQDEAKEKLNKLLEDIRKAKLRHPPTEAIKLHARPTKKIIADSGPKESKNRRRNPKATAEVKVTDEIKIESGLLDAAHQVATQQSSLEPDEDLRHTIFVKTESELLSKLKSMVTETKEAKLENEISGTSPTLSSILDSMKIEKRQPPETDSGSQTREKFKSRKVLSEEEKAFLEKRRMLRRKQIGQNYENETSNIDLFGAEPLGIFTTDFQMKTESDSEVNSTWKKCFQRELKILSSPTPRNFLEEMAVWTEKGILWHFPINNEQGIDEKEMEPYYQHVFLEPHLDPWCPQRGPLRHFMELICVGLSKNPHLTVEKKLEHINWFREYFERKDHKEILKITGALDV